MADSVQQIKFAFASYVKEFGADFRDWSVGTAEDACRALFEDNAVDAASDPWLWKPALSPAAAGMIQAFLERHGAAPARTPAPGPEVFLFRRSREEAGGERRGRSPSPLRPAPFAREDGRSVDPLGPPISAAGRAWCRRAP